MLQEIYCREKEDKNAIPGLLDHSNVYEAVLTKLRMILMTEKGSVFGCPEFGAGVETYVFSTDCPAEDIKQAINDQIALFVPEINTFKITVDVNFQKGESSDICYIDIKIDGHDALGYVIK